MDRGGTCKCHSINLLSAEHGADPVPQKRMCLIAGSVQRHIFRLQPCLLKGRDQFLRSLLCPGDQDMASRRSCMCQTFSKFSCIIYLRHKIREESSGCKCFSGGRTNGTDLYSRSPAQHVSYIQLQLRKLVEEDRYANGTGKYQPSLSLFALKPVKRIPQRYIGRNGFRTDCGHLNDLRSQFSQSLCQHGHILSWTGKEKTPSAQDPVFRPVKLIRKRTHLSYKNNSRCADPGSVCCFFQPSNGRCDPPLIRCGSPLQDGGGHIRIHSRIHQTVKDHFHGGYSHKERQSSVQLHQRFKVYMKGAVLPGVTGYDMKGRCIVSVRDRNSRISRHSYRRRNTRHHFKGNPGLHQLFQFFPASSEDKRVSSLEPQHILPLLRLTDKDPADLLLRNRVVSCVFSHVDGFLIRRNVA